MAFDWLLDLLPAYQMPGLKIFTTYNGFLQAILHSHDQPTKHVSK